MATTSLGRVLTDGRGRTLYLFTSDRPGRSLCLASCLTNWPAAAPVPAQPRPAGVTGAVSSTADTADRRVVTVGGWPCCTFVQDTAPGDVTGQGVKSFGGTW